MSTVSGVGSSAAPYQPKPAAPVKPTQPPPQVATSDADHDGDSDGAGLDVKG